MKFVRTDKSGQNQIYRESKADRDKLKIIRDNLLETIKMFMTGKSYDEVLNEAEKIAKKKARIAARSAMSKPKHKA